MAVNLLLHYREISRRQNKNIIGLRFLKNRLYCHMGIEIIFYREYIDGRAAISGLENPGDAVFIFERYK